MESPEERPIAEWMNPYIDLYLNEARPLLLKRASAPTIALWISSNTGEPMNAGDVRVIHHPSYRTDNWDRDFTAFVSDGGRHYGGRSERRNASPRKRIARSQACPGHRRTLQSRKQPSGCEPIR